ncbi:BTB/POZ domain-containing protein 3-like [Mercenaria mercenaria]|uniref:BTB/POZ domain-containing protein 3-like n=1 Tax=Mercenaria mercenaria TaxID=6596 RepID=UPI00234E60A8|nr:BTB/POZ domain-containing protein 3-like [Mercenaria mercenaria]
MDASTNVNQSQHTLLPGWQLGKDLSCCMTELYDKKLWTDVKFRCKDHDDDERIHAHKTILAARSPVFQAMFFGAFAECREEVSIKDAKKEIFELLLRYMYSDTVALKKDTASELLQMAHLYQVPSLVEVCANFIATNIRPENACEILTLALSYDITILKEACCTVIDKNARLILKSNGFMDLKEEILLYILKGDTFYADEEEIFYKVEEWSTRKLTQLGLEHVGDNIRKILGDLFYQLRLPAMSCKALVKCTRKKAYLTAEEYINIVDFINDIPETSVLSNSCVSRLPVNDTLIIDIGDAEKIQSHCPSTSIQIHVAKDVELISFGLFDIEPCYKYDHCVQTNSEDNVESSADIGSFFESYRGKVIGLYKSLKRRVVHYKSVPEIDISRSFCPVIHGRLSISRRNFTHNFELDTQTNEIIYLKQPLKLEKSNVYTVEIQLEYSCCKRYTGCNRHLQIRYSESKNVINCKKDPVKVSNVYAYRHSLLESIQFRNLANR